MKFAASASSIAPVFLIAGLFLLAACDDIKIPHIFARDNVPPEVKAEPRLVTTPPPVSDQSPWPLVASVPFKPKDFTPKPAYNHYMNELEYDRAESGEAKKEALENDPTAPDAASQNPAAQNTGPVLAPPLLPETSKE